MKKNNKGFSLVELIVVIAIMAILAAVAVASFSIYIDRAQEESDENYLRNIIYFAILYSTEYQIPLEGLVVDPIVESGANIKLIIGYEDDGRYNYYDKDRTEYNDIGNPDISGMIYDAVGPGYVEGGFDNGNYQPGDDEVVIPPNNTGDLNCPHTNMELFYEQEATCAQIGLKQYKCSDCSKTETIVENLKNHSFSEVASEGKYTYYTCDDCGRIQIKSSDGSVIVPID